MLEIKINMPLYFFDINISELTRYYLLIQSEIILLNSDYLIITYYNNFIILY